MEGLAPAAAQACPHPELPEGKDECPPTPGTHRYHRTRTPVPCCPLSPTPLTFSPLLPFRPRKPKAPCRDTEGLEGRPQPRGHCLTRPHRALAEPGGGGGCAYLHPTGSWITNGTRGTHRALGTENQQKREPPLGKRTQSPRPGHEVGISPLPEGPSLRLALLGQGDPAGMRKM